MKIVLLILFLFAGIGTINGILVGIYLLLARTDLHKKFLGALLIALSIRIGKSVFYYFADSIDRLILQIGLSACLFIGPFFFKYVYSKIHQESSFSFRDRVFFLALLAAVVGIGMIYPYRVFPEIWNGYIIQVIYVVWLIFVLLGIYLSRIHIKNIYNAKGLSTLLKDEVFIVTIAVSFITITYQFALYISGFTYIWGALGFTVFFYYMLAHVLLSHNKKAKTGDSVKPIENGASLLLHVNDVISKNKLYLNNKLKLDELSSHTDLDRNTLSRVLNEVYPHGFSRYVNDFRVKEAMKLIEDRPELSLEGIGYEAGFNSKSSFFAAFKKIANCTPAQFKRKTSEV